MNPRRHEHDQSSRRRVIGSVATTVTALAGSAALATLAGCSTTAKRPEHAGPAPAYAEIAAAQGHRLEGLARLQARGSIELRWVDDEGRHFENGDLDLWLELPRRTALRISKLTSEDLFWLGSDEQRYWFFDLLSSPSVLLTAGHDTDLAAFGTVTAIPLRPLVLIDLLGLTPLPPEAALPLEWDERLDSWSVVAPGVGGPVRIGFHADSLLPARVEALRPDGTVAVSSMLGQYASVEVPGTAPLDRPRLPERIEVVETGERGSITLFLREHSGDVDPQRMERLCDLQVLVGALRPDRTEER